MGLELIYKDEVYDIVGACMEVHRELGNGFLEAVYHEALEIEFQNMEISYIHEKPLNIFYKGRKLRKEYIPDFVCFDKIIVELKCADEICNEHISQVLNYLKATGYRLGLLVNFGSESLIWKRIVK